MKNKKKIKEKKVYKVNDGIKKRDWEVVGRKRWRRKWTRKEYIYIKRGKANELEEDGNWEGRRNYKIKGCNRRKW